MNRLIPNVSARLFAVAAAALLCASPVLASAQDIAVPYWASMSKDKANVRVGPGLTYRIAWVYQRKGLPVKVLRTMGGWRLIEDPDGARGWLLSRFLSRTRTAMVKGDQNARMLENPDGTGRVLWRAQPGVVGRLGDCEAGWCKIDVGGRKGWIGQSHVWGVGNP
ncbi:SH3 domain-containing protein [Novosphingobium sp. ZN18A2]|uniref:SH3 domain-containing protein n=1 Tax=Novosphingobium sp. ZN18A2 TaxID=3079861 RepID=UPI0030D54CC5